MDSIVDVKQALAARSRTTTLDDLKSQGRRLVKVIRAEHIAAMLQEAVQKAIEGSGLMSREEVDLLVARSQQEFKHLVKERQDEAADAQRAEEEIVALRQQCEQLTGELQSLRDSGSLGDELGRPGDVFETQVVELQVELEQLRGELDQLRTERDGFASKLREADRSDATGELEKALQAARSAQQQAQQERDAMAEKLDAAGGDAASLRVGLDKVAAERDALQREVEQLRGELQAARAELERAQAALAKAQASPATAGSEGMAEEFRQACEDRDRAARDLETARAELARAQSRNDVFRDQLADLESHLSKFTALQATHKVHNVQPMPESSGPIHEPMRMADPAPAASAPPTAAASAPVAPTAAPQPTPLAQPSAQEPSAVPAAPAAPPAPAAPVSPQAPAAPAVDPVAASPEQQMLAAALSSPDVNPELVMKLMTEVAELKAKMMTGTGPASAPAAASGGGGGGGADPEISEALNKLAGSINDRLEKFGRKMGISSAVEAGDVSFDGLFAHGQDENLESNMDDVQVKKKTGGGIAANLARLKKLKGGG